MLGRLPRTTDPSTPNAVFRSGLRFRCGVDQEGLPLVHNPGRSRALSMASADREYSHFRNALEQGLR